jgi:hypothetical protein
MGASRHFLQTCGPFRHTSPSTLVVVEQHKLFTRLRAIMKLRQFLLVLAILTVVLLAAPGMLKRGDIGKSVVLHDLEGLLIHAKAVTGSLDDNR